MPCSCFHVQYIRVVAVLKKNSVCEDNWTVLNNKRGQSEYYILHDMAGESCNCVQLKLKQKFFLLIWSHLCLISCPECNVGM